jgi:hypothetical protein
MAMAIGTVAVDSNEAVTGTGLARELYDADVATRTIPTMPTLGQTTAPFSPGFPARQVDLDAVKAARVSIKQEAARLANAYATAIVTHITTNGKAKVLAGAPSGGIQRTPNPNNPATDCLGPTTDFLIGII